ncbi:MAB_1171c family putative transporter [Streptomyces sp. JNUCC 64]
MDLFPHLAYGVPTALLAVAVLLKLPALLRAWRDPDIRATILLLAWATAVLVIIHPVSIHRLNVLTGVPNIASPAAYSFLTASCATTLAMITRWREPPSERRRRRMLRIRLVYAGIGAALWVTFLLAHAPEARVYDLDTYYASTPWMREHILLYLAAHTASSVIASALLWKWYPEVVNRWLKSGVVLMQLGFASGLMYDLAKLTAIAAHWTGTDWDVLSTRIAPPFALLQAMLGALGFIVPQAGPFLSRRIRDRRDYRRLYPLWRAVRASAPSAATARLGRWAPLDLRLLQREQHIHDALRLLAPHLDHTLHGHAYRTARLTRDEEESRGLAGALALTAALDRYRAGAPLHPAPDGPAPDLGDHLHAISRAMRHPRALDTLRSAVPRAENVTLHG